MTEYEIRGHAIKYRLAVEAALKDGKFDKDIVFQRFPHGCCGDTCYLLAEYLTQFGIETIWYSAERDDWSHAWLVVKDDMVKEPTNCVNVFPEEIWSTLASYGVEHPEKPIDNTRYEEINLKDGLIIDITADQFADYDIPVYVGKIDSFHREFDFIQAHDYESLGSARLYRLYKTIKLYLE